METQSFVGPQLRNTALFESVDGFCFDFYIGVGTAYLEFSIEIHKISERHTPTPTKQRNQNLLYTWISINPVQLMKIISNKKKKNMKQIKNKLLKKYETNK